MKFLESQTPTKLRGGYYTHPDIAAFLARWVLDANPISILEPSAGDGVFLGALASMGAPSLKSVFSCEIDAREAEKTKAQSLLLPKVKVNVVVGDFLRWSLNHLGESYLFDGVLGNPPYIRYQYLSEEQQQCAEGIFARSQLTFTRHTNAWVPFVVASMDHLRPGGRLAMVIPTEILHLPHSRSLRRYLITQCSRVTVIDPTELWFDGVLQGVILLLAEKKQSESERSEGIGIINVPSRRFLSEPPDHLLEHVDWVNGDSIHGKWMKALLTTRERELLDEIGASGKVKKFNELAKVDVGIVTGANSFFLVPDSVVEEHGLERWAHPMFGRSSHVRGVIYDDDTHTENKRIGLPANFLWFGDVNEKELPVNVQKYIELGEQQNLHTRYKCRIRSPWYAVPSVFSAPVGMLKRSHHFPRLILNRMNALTTDTSYRVWPKANVSAEALGASFVNSLTALSAELEGRHYGGGVLELVPSEIEELIIPRPEPDMALEMLHAMLRKEHDPDAIMAIQDRAILQSVGLTKTQCDDLRTAWIRLRKRRQRISDVPG